MKTQDLLNEISQLSHYSDKQIHFRNGKFKYSYEQIYPMWKDHWDNFIGKAGIYKKYGIQHQTFMKYCGYYNLPLRSFDDMLKSGKISEYGKIGGAAQPKMVDRHNDIIGGMDINTFCQKYQCSRSCYSVMKCKLKKRGLLNK